MTEAINNTKPTEESIQWKLSEDSIQKSNRTLMGVTDETYYKVSSLDIPALNGNGEQVGAVLVMGSTQSLADERAKSICNSMNKPSAWRTLDTLSVNNVVLLSISHESGGRFITTGFLSEDNTEVPVYYDWLGHHPFDAEHLVLGWMPMESLPEIVNPEAIKAKQEAVTAWSW